MTTVLHYSEPFIFIIPSSQYDLNNVERDVKHQTIITNVSVLVAVLDARPAVVQEVMCSIPARSGNHLSFSPFRCFQKGSCKFVANEYAQILVNCLED